MFLAFKHEMKEISKVAMRQGLWMHWVELEGEYTFKLNYD